MPLMRFPFYALSDYGRFQRNCCQGSYDEKPDEDSDNDDSDEPNFLLSRRMDALMMIMMMTMIMVMLIKIRVGENKLEQIFIVSLDSSAIAEIKWICWYQLIRSFVVP